jgi:hypothetical protein
VALQRCTAAQRNPDVQWMQRSCLLDLLTEYDVIQYDYKFNSFIEYWTTVDFAELYGAKIGIVLLG